MCEPFEGWIMYRCTTWKTTSPSPWRVLLFNPPEGNHCLELIKNIHHSSCIGPIQVTSWEITQTELGPFFPEWGPFIWENCTGLVPLLGSLSLFLRCLILFWEHWVTGWKNNERKKLHLEVVLATAHLPFSAWSGEYFIKSLRYYVNYNSLKPRWPASMSCSSKALVAPTTVWLIQRGQHSFDFYFLNFYSKYSVPSMSSSPPSPSPSWLFLLRPGSQDKLLYLAFIGTAGDPHKKSIFRNRSST